MWAALFGQTQPRDPRDMVRDWRLVLRKEDRQLERQILTIEREVEKTKCMIKESVRKKDSVSCRLLAREIVRARKAVKRIHAAKAKLMSVENNITHQLAILRVSGTLQRSAEVMKDMHDLFRVSDVTEAMRDLSKEMMKAGVIEEMVDDVFGDLEDDEDLEEEVQKEVEKVLWDVTAGQLGKAPAAVRDPLPSNGATAAMEREMKELEEDSDIIARLEALRS